MQRSGSNNSGMKSQPDDLISTAEAARILKLSVQQVRQHARAKPPHNLPSVRIGRDWLFRRADVNSFQRRPVGKPKKT